ncbi:uncharacterized protein LOC112199164 [Rosa chinensis]|uniref:uncharacterized protein LOC112199164 n=1 Tax=Rosa chinensis TaxID=74649 RepID=UPI001AD89FE2|nr:uncharacterized protein LOC112199164 [Rosa chinensis]
MAPLTPCQLLLERPVGHLGFNLASLATVVVQFATISNGTVYEKEIEPLGPATYYVTDTNRWRVSNVGLKTQFVAASYLTGTNIPKYIYNIHFISNRKYFKPYAISECKDLCFITQILWLGS